MYNDLFTIPGIGLTIHTYGLMTGLGVVAALLLSWRRAKKYGVSEDAVSTLCILLLVCGYAGAKLLYVLTNWKTFLERPLSLLGSEGFVVYGGLLFGFLSAWVYTRRRKESLLMWADMVLPGVAVAQGLGRIGCFFAGCCYGRPTDSFLGVVFPAGSLAPAGVPLLPTQLFSSAGDLAIAGILLLLDRKPGKTGRITAWYLALYGVGRFCIEFFRNDYRGTVGFLSTSQFLSLFFVGYAIFLAVSLRRKTIQEDGQ